MSKRTPGPWDAWIDCSSFPITGPGAAASMSMCSVSDEFQRLLIQIGSASGEAPAVATGNSVERARANARLIAAAPDLLSAAKAVTGMLELFADYNRINESADGIDRQSADAFRKLADLRAAIAKAEAV